MTEYAYHATLMEFLPSIAKEGLKPTPHATLDGEPMLFVEASYEEAAIYLDILTGAMLRFPCGTNLPTTDDGETYIQETIPPHEIEAEIAGNWTPLKKA